jgi:choline kinase
MDNFTVIIPTADYGRRMKSYGPKSLIRIDGYTTLLDLQLKSIKETFGQVDTIFITGNEHKYIADKITANKENKYIRVVQNKKYDSTSVAASISLGIELAKNNNILVIYGDLFFQPELFSNATNNNFCIFSETSDHNKVGCSLQENRVLNFDFGFNNQFREIFYLTSEYAEKYADLTYKKPYRNKFLSHEIFNLMLAEGMNFEYVSANSPIVEVNSPDNIVEARKLLRKEPA